MTRSETKQHRLASTPTARKWNVRGLPSAAAERLLRRTYALERAIFDGIEPFSDYSQRILSSDAHSLTLWTFEDGDGSLVGYNFVSFFRVPYAGRPIEVLRANSGLLPAYRRYNRIIGAGLAPCLMRRLRSPSTPAYFHAWLAHPSGYASIEPYLSGLYPSARTDPAPASMEAIVRFLNQRFGARCPDPANPWIVETGASVVDDPEDRRAWETSARPSVRYFLERNPDYARGRALTVLTPITLGTLWAVAMKLIRTRVKKARIRD